MENCPTCGGEVERDESAKGQWRTQDGKFHLNGRCAHCRSRSKGSSDRFGLFWRHVSDPSKPFINPWRHQGVGWGRPGSPVSPCGCPELIGYQWPNE